MVKSSLIIVENFISSKKIITNFFVYLTVFQFSSSLFFLLALLYSLVLCYSFFRRITLFTVVMLFFVFVSWSFLSISLLFCSEIVFEKVLYSGDTWSSYCLCSVFCYVEQLMTLYFLSPVPLTFIKNQGSIFRGMWFSPVDTGHV